MVPGVRGQVEELPFREVERLNEQRPATGTWARFPVGLRYMAEAAFFFSLMSLLVKKAGEVLPSQEIVLARSVVVLALTWGLLRRRGTPLWGNARRFLLMRGAVGFTALSCFYYGVVHLPLADVTVIQYTNPVFTAVLAALFLGEGVGMREALPALASLAGVVLIARPGFLFAAGGTALDHLAVAVAFIGALCSAGAYVLVRRLGASEDPLVIVFYFAWVSTLGSLPALGKGFVMPRGHMWWVLLGVGVTTQLGQVYLTWGLQRERAGRAMAVGYLQIVFATLWGVLFFQEIPDRWTCAGAALVVGGTLLLGSGSNRDRGAGGAVVASAEPS